MNWSAEKAAYAFAMLGFVSALIQGGLIRRLVPRFGEARLILVGLAIEAVGFAAMAEAGNTPRSLLGSLVMIGLGMGLMSPSVQGLLSRVTPSTEQGARSLAR